MAAACVYSTVSRWHASKGTPISLLNKSTHLWLSGSIREALSEYGLQDMKVATTTVDVTTRLQKETDATADPAFESEYQSKTGTINYITVKGRPDISYAASPVSRYSSNPNQHHMDAVNGQRLAGSVAWVSGTQRASTVAGYRMIRPSGANVRTSHSHSTFAKPSNSIPPQTAAIGRPSRHGQFVAF
ncbi:hypothetical protein LTR56_022700 [Elasticomyces elasticus]|nr:hypothetical protein LTR56_022700 [Elasticomyces elasticus]KAK3641712.1 hypothetical protein LTR22_016420 [Elasticomyces elasticus]KAK4917306.1 hypothetical protein LTR49_014790 [Elasticomyces elasticus]KAK5764877.1 hypothetical protein LTS12_004904 [Elasticomyces elasticus]